MNTIQMKLMIHGLQTKDVFVDNGNRKYKNQKQLLKAMMYSAQL